MRERDRGRERVRVGPSRQASRRGSPLVPLSLHLLLRGVRGGVRSKGKGVRMRGRVRVRRMK